VKKYFKENWCKAILKSDAAEKVFADGLKNKKFSMCEKKNIFFSSPDAL
jgi:hypothetical protein